VRTVDDLEAELNGLTGMRVLVRSDLNVPLDRGRITDDGRVRASLATLTDLRVRGAKVIVMAHLGRPGGRQDPAYSLRPVSSRLGELLGVAVVQASDTVGEGARATVDAMTDGDVVVLENVRFNAGETSKDDSERGAFADQLAALGDAFVSDGFGVVHRKQASVYDIANRLPHAAGGLVIAEVSVLRRLTESPQRPYVVVLGGSKVADKLGVIDNLLSKADRLLIGGGMVFTFLAAQGHQVGKSLLEADQVEVVGGYLRQAESAGVEIVLPVDVVVAPDISADAPAQVVPVGSMPDDQVGLDIGPQSSALFAEKLADARTAFWNGPMGVFEIAQFSSGTRAVAKALTGIDGLSVVGGGDSAAAVRQLGFSDDEFGHISTGGGASLEYIEGKLLPGIDVLER
jgi:phosphoglycerate kinase